MTTLLRANINLPMYNQKRTKNHGKKNTLPLPTGPATTTSCPFLTDKEISRITATSSPASCINMSNNKYETYEEDWVSRPYKKSYILKGWTEPVQRPMKKNNWSFPQELHCYHLERPIQLHLILLLLVESEMITSRTSSQSVVSLSNRNMD